MAYRIALFSSDWNVEYSQSMYENTRRYCTLHEGVRVDIFSSHLGIRENKHKRGAATIYGLPNLSVYDGVILRTAQIHSPEIIEALAAEAKRLSIPLVTMDKPVAGAMFVGTDNYKAMTEMVCHVLDNHNAARLVYVSGPKGAFEAEERKRAFLDVMQTRGITEDNYEIVYADWKTEVAAEQVEAILQRGDIPDAIICANDESAFGALNAIKAVDRKLIKQVAVTGFDNITLSFLYSPQLTTVERDLMAQNATAIEMITTDDHNGGEKTAYIPHELLIRESCGCGNRAEMDSVHTRNSLFDMVDGVKARNKWLAHLSEELFEAANLYEIMEAIERSGTSIGHYHYIICVNRRYQQSFGVPGTEPTKYIENEAACMATNVPWRDYDEEHVYEVVDNENLLPDTLREKERVFAFYPLHYVDFSIGYVVLFDNVGMHDRLFFKTLFALLESAIESCRRRLESAHTNRMLGNLYERDKLTGLFNRFGLERRGQMVFDAIRRGGDEAVVLFADLDNMKTINDVYGHEMGDTALIQTATILRDAIKESVDEERHFIMRYGGDEFIIVAGDITIKDAIERRLARWNEERDVPFSLEISIGEVVVAPDEETSLEACIEEADQRMYLVKRKKKRGR